MDKELRIKNKASCIKVLLALLYTMCFILYTNITTVKAFDVMTTYKVSDSQAASGDILSNISGKGLVRASTAYDTKTFGVIVDDPTIVLRDVNPTQEERPVATQGDVAVNVTDYNGQIQPGDYIAASPITGKGMKATAGGFVLGTATSTVTKGQTVSFNGKNYQSGQVQVTLRIGYNTPTSQAVQSIFSSIASTFLKNAQDPSGFAVVVRYIMAGLLAGLAFAIGLFAFTRSIAKGIEAMGRNPLAKKAIQTSIIVQVILTVFVTICAIALAFLILRA